MANVQLKNSVVSMSLTNGCIKGAVKSYTMSKRYINTVLKASVINILYHRLNIDDAEFITKTFKDVAYKSFRTKAKHVVIREFHNYMIACKHAIDRDYLKSFYLFFIDRNSRNILENYKFSFKYTERTSASGVARNENNLIQATCELLSTFENLGKYAKLDTEDIRVKVEFTYFEDTPCDYQPPGFRGIDESKSLTKKINKNGNSVALGTLFTGFHQLKCFGRAGLFEFLGSQYNSGAADINDDNETGIKDNNAGTEEENSEEIDHEIPIVNYDAPSTMNDPSTSKLTPPVIQEYRMNDTYISYTAETISSDDELLEIIDCPCELSYLNLHVDKIDCVKCKRKCHAACNGYVDKSFLGNDKFVCSFCKSDDEHMSTNVSPNMSMLCKFRFILGYFYKHGTIPQELGTVFNSLMQNTTFKLIDTNTKSNKIAFNANIINELFKFHFKSPEWKKFDLNSN